MAVSVGGIVDNTDYIGLVDRLNSVLGNGSGQTGYGQVCSSAEDYKDRTDVTNPVKTAADITSTAWNALRTDINRSWNHQQGGNSGISPIASTAIIGADATGLSVTRISGDTFSINSPDNDEGFNDFDSRVASIESNSNLIASGQFELTTGQQFVNSSRTTAWGAPNNTDLMIFSELTVEFEGGYDTTDSTGEVVTASAADHRRHFFNAGGEIRLSASLSGSTEKDTDWGTMLGNMDQVIFGKNATTLSDSGSGRARDGNTNVDGAGGIESALGNFQVTTGYQLIFQKNGSQTEYAENLVAIYVKRNNAGTILTFLFEFYDNDSGDQRPRDEGAGDPPGPGIDESVLASGGSMSCGIDLKRPNVAAHVNIPAPAAAVQTELRLT